MHKKEGDHASKGSVSYVDIDRSKIFKINAIEIRKPTFGTLPDGAMALSGAGPLDTATPMPDTTSRTENLNIELYSYPLRKICYGADAYRQTR